MRRFVAVLSIAVASLGLAPGIVQSADVLTTADPNIVLDIAKGFGSATLDKDSRGNPKVSGRLQGLNYAIYFHSCPNAENCRSIQFLMGYEDPFTPDRANEWNKTYRWVAGYSDDGSNFKMDVDFAGGVTREHVEAQFTTWNAIIADIKEFVRQ